MNKRSKFDGLEIYPVRVMGDETVIVPDDKADFYSLYGLVTGEVNGYYIPIGDYKTRAQAELTRDYLE